MYNNVRFWTDNGIRGDTGQFALALPSPPITEGEFKYRPALTRIVWLTMRRRSSIEFRSRKHWECFDCAAEGRQVLGGLKRWQIDRLAGTCLG